MLALVAATHGALSKRGMPQLGGKLNIVYCLTCTNAIVGKRLYGSTRVFCTILIDRQNKKG